MGFYNCLDFWGFMSIKTSWTLQLSGLLGLLQLLFCNCGYSKHNSKTQLQHKITKHNCCTKSKHTFAQAFSRRHATVAPSYHGLFVFRRECRWFYITWLCCSCGYCWRYTLWKFDSSIVSNFCVLRGAYVQKSPECKYFVVHILFTVSRRVPKARPSRDSIGQ